MIDSTLIEPKETTIGGKKFLLSKLPATVGREVLLVYASEAGGGGTSFENVPLEKSLRLLSYASIKLGDSWQRLETKELIDAHILNVLDYVSLEQQMLDHSMDFSSTAKS